MRGHERRLAFGCWFVCLEEVLLGHYLRVFGRIGFVGWIRQLNLDGPIPHECLYMIHNLSISKPRPEPSVASAVHELVVSARRDEECSIIAGLLGLTNPLTARNHPLFVPKGLIVGRGVCFGPRWHFVCVEVMPRV